MTLRRTSSVLWCVAALSCATAREAGDDEKPAAGNGGVLTGCRILPSAAAICDDGAVILDVAHAKGADGAARIAAVWETTDRPDDDYTIVAGTAVAVDDDGTSRVDAVRPQHVDDAVVGTVTFFAPSAGDAVVSCAAFGKHDGNCLARARALLNAAPTQASPGAQRRPRGASFPPAPAGCTGDDDQDVLRYTCASGAKVSVAAIDGTYGPAAAWWLLHRVVQSQTTAPTMFTTCNVLGQSVPCAVVNGGADARMLFGAAVSAGEVRLARCVLPADADGIPPACAAAVFPREPNPSTRLIGYGDVVVRAPACKLTQPNHEDGWARSAVCDDGSLVVQLTDPSDADTLIGASAMKAAPSDVPCKVRGAASHCTVWRGASGASLWRADVDGDPRVRVFMCRGPSEASPSICEGFIEAAP